MRAPIRLFIVFLLALSCSLAAPTVFAAEAPAAKQNAPKAEPAKGEPAKADAKAETKTDSKAAAKADAKAGDKQDDKNAAKADAKTEAKPEAAAAPEPPITNLPLHDPWESVWTNQKAMLDEINQKAAAMGDTFTQKAMNLNGKVQPYMEEARRLLVLVNTYKNWPNPVEAVSRRITTTVIDLNKILEPVMVALILFTK